MKRFISSLAVAAALGVAAYSLADAQGRGRGPAFGPAGPGGPGIGRGVMLALRTADLTDQQKDEIRALMEAERAGRRAQPADAQLHRQLETEIFSEAPDANQLAALQQQIVHAESLRLARRIALEQRIAQLLTAEQRAQIRERLSTAPNPGQRGGQRGSERRR